MSFFSEERCLKAWELRKQGLTYREIALHFGIPAGKANGARERFRQLSNLGAALERLRQRKSTNNKENMIKHDKDENGQPMDAFEEMLKVMDTEQLIRLRYRLQKVKRKKMIELLSEEIKLRDSQPEGDGQ